MTVYLFETSQFGISDNGVHLLKNKFNFDTIDYADIESLVIEEGKEMNNWFLFLVLGISSVTFSAWYTFRLFNAFNNYEVQTVSNGEIILSIISFMVGHFFVYSSTRNATLLKIKTVRNKSFTFSVKAIEKANKLDECKMLLLDKLKARASFSL